MPETPPSHASDDLELEIAAIAPEVPAMPTFAQQLGTAVTAGQQVLLDRFLRGKGAAEKTVLFQAAEPGCA